MPQTRVDAAGVVMGTVANPDRIDPTGVTSQPIHFQRPTAAALSSAIIDTATSGDNTLVTGVAAQTVRVWRIIVVFSGTVNVRFKSAATNLTGAKSMKDGGAIVLDLTNEPWFVTASGEGFLMNLSAAIQASGRIWYTQS